jgi:putative DNA primase/helicase
MQKIFYDSSKGRPDETTMEVIRCLGGALIFPKNKLRQLTIFLGGGSNGKSVIMNVLGMFFSKEHTTYLSLEELSAKNFERSRLLKSRINFCKEQKGGQIDSEEIKAIVYGEGVTIRRKNKEAVEFIPRTKIVVAANSRPYFNDTSYGLERRLTIVSFDNTFFKRGKYSKVKDPEKQGVFLAEDDDELMNKLKKEKSQILNYFIVGLKRLIDNNWELPESMATKEIKDEYLEGNDTIGTWLKDNYEVDETKKSSILATDILIKYRQWYSENVSTKPLNYATSTLGTKISEIFRVKSIRKTYLGRRLTGYPLIEKYATENDIQESNDISSGSDVGALTQDGFPEL